MFKKVVLVGVSLFSLLFCGCDSLSFAEEGTETLPFQVRLGKVYVSGQDDLLTTCQVRFYTQILSRRSGIAIGKTIVGKDDIYLLNLSYELYPDVFDIVGGIASVKVLDVDGVDLRWNFGVNVNVNVYKLILKTMIEVLPF